MTETSPDSPCTCGSGKPFCQCCGDADAPFWNERANGRIKGTFFDPPLAKYVAKEPVCELDGTIFPPGILVRQLGSEYHLQEITEAIVSTEQAAAALVKTADHSTSLISNRVTGIVEQGAMAGPIVDLVRRVYASEIEPFFNCKLRSLETPHVLRYTRGSHYKPHSDSDVIDTATGRWKKAQDRD